MTRSGKRRDGARPGRGWALVALVLAVLLAAATLTPQPAGAQLFELSEILGGKTPAQEAQSARQAPPVLPDPRPPLQSLPVRPFDPAAAPSATDYARVANAAVTPETFGARGVLDRTETFVGIFRARLIAILVRAPHAFGEIGTTLAAASPTGRPIYFLGIAVFAALLLVLGRAVVELYYMFVARPVFVRMQRADPVGFTDKLPVLMNRVLLGLVGLVALLVIASLVGLIFYEEHVATNLTVLTVFATYAALNMINVLWRMVLAPYLPEYRLPPIGDGEARRLYMSVNAASVTGVVGAAFCFWVEELGLPREPHVLVTLVATLVTVVLLLVTIRANAAAVGRIILSGRPRAEVSWITRVAASLWAPVAVLYLIASWADLGFRLVMGIDAGPGRIMVPYFVLIAGIVVYGAIMYAIERVFERQRRIRALNRAAEERRMAEDRADATVRAAAIRDDAFFGDTADMDADGDEEGGTARLRLAPPVPPRGSPALTPESGAEADGEAVPPPMPPLPAGPGMRTMEDLARRMASLLAVGTAAYVLLQYWGLGAFVTESAAFGMAESLIDVLLVGYIVFHATRIWLDQKIAEEGGDDLPATPLDGEGGGVGASRLATLLPLVRNSILTVIAVSVALLAAIELGVNVAPLFAGAGIVGLAIGFGAQTLVRDIISGAFFLIDDAFRKGEYIDVGEVKGTVEKISVRSFQLRHHLGALHTIPFGEITHLTNFSRDWVMMKLPLRLTYDTDVEKVRKLVKKLGQELLDDPTIGDKFLQPLKSQGVIQMEDSAMIVRVKFMTRPGDQWVVRKRVYQDIRDLFEREGIHFAHREVTVRIPNLPQGHELSADERHAAGAAARAAIDIADTGALATGTHGPIDDR
ncbi:mechanosensitive ion channel family protein [Limibaculum sp. FT325]|uniref:mechanosensitive ion channel family protein n=1 Tax=Thermohalobaculum sediminis TaxID=2939436 RepID=UPI0020BD7351|nr:mechanosensitive ion channel family protein [Limibaculum sediminis]MCL5778138.1 mechanosensitive ion channel family protein [Limibaculum sediminis]